MKKSRFSTKNEQKNGNFEGKVEDKIQKIKIRFINFGGFLIKFMCFLLLYICLIIYI